jgi:hypothetical protein
MLGVVAVSRCEGVDVDSYVALKPEARQNNIEISNCRPIERGLRSDYGDHPVNADQGQKVAVCNAKHIQLTLRFKSAGYPANRLEWYDGTGLHLSVDRIYC